MRMYKKISIGLILCAVLLPNIASAAAYSDIAGHLDEKYVVGYSDLGLVNGYPDGTFRPDVTLTRAEATVLLCSHLPHGVLRSKNREAYPLRPKWM